MLQDYSEATTSCLASRIFILKSIISRIFKIIKSAYQNKHIKYLWPCIFYNHYQGSRDICKFKKAKCSTQHISNLHGRYQNHHYCKRYSETYIYLFKFFADKCERFENSTC